MSEYSMIISDAVYQVYKEKKVGVSAIIDGKKTSVPLDIKNRHYAEIMRQVNEGSLTIAEAD